MVWCRRVGSGGGYTFLYISDTDSSAVSSVSDRQTQSTGYVETVIGSSLAPLTSLLMPFTGSIDPVVHLGGLIGSAKSHL